MLASSHNSDLGRWQTASRSADARLRFYVRGFFGSSGFLPAPVRERHLPSTEVPLLINFAAPHRRHDGEGWANLDGAWIVGLHDTHTASEASGAREFMVVRFTPVGAHLFLGVPMHLLSNRAVALAEIDGELARKIASCVGLAKTWPARFTAMETLITKRVMDAALPASTNWAWNALMAADGRTALGALADKAGCSHRTLIAQFRTHIGLTPKTAARVLRFNRALHLLSGESRLRSSQTPGKPFVEIARAGDLSAPAVEWAGLAADSGYSDQAHFIREFRHFAGVTPARFARLVSDIA